jgi:hypothetical protein
VNRRPSMHDRLPQRLECPAVTPSSNRPDQRGLRWPDAIALRRRTRVLRERGGTDTSCTASSLSSDWIGPDLRRPGVCDSSDERVIPLFAQTPATTRLATTLERACR